MIIRENKIMVNLYLDYVNNFLTIQTWAEHHGIPLQEAPDVLERCKLAYQETLPSEYLTTPSTQYPVIII